MGETAQGLETAAEVVGEGQYCTIKCRDQTPRATILKANCLEITWKIHTAAQLKTMVGQRELGELTVACAKPTA
jgi:hypothetical protein